MSWYVEPTAARQGAAGTQFLRAIYRDTNLPRLIPLSALITTVAGLLLYELLSYSDAMSSPMGLVLTAGASFGLLAFLHGFFAVWRPAGRFAGALKAASPESRSCGAGRQASPQRPHQPVAGDRLAHSDGGRALYRSRLRLRRGEPSRTVTRSRQLSKALAGVYIDDPVRCQCRKSTG